MNALNVYNKDIEKHSEQHKVKSMYEFGSVLTNQFNNESDIDLIVDFQEIPVEEYADNYFDLKFSLQNLFQERLTFLKKRQLEILISKKTLKKLES